MESLISIIVPVYNVELYINKCIESIINQTYNNIEIILVDDGSTDSSGKICDEYKEKDRRIKVIHKENGGLSDARNAGISAASGKYITFIDSDDYVDEDYVEILHDLIIKYNVKMSICSHKVIYDTGKIIDKQDLKEECYNKEEVYKKILYDNGIDLSAWAKLYEVSLFNNVKFPKERLYEDAATTYLLIDQCDKISVNSISKYNYVIRRNSITNDKFSIRKMDLIISTKEMTDYIKQKYPSLEFACNRRLMYAYLSTLAQLVKDKEKHENEQKTIMMYIKYNRKSILHDKNIPRRDRIALNCTKLGFKFFKLTWKIYEKITSRK